MGFDERFQLLELARAVRSRLSGPRAVAGVRVLPVSDTRAWETDTGGYGIAVARVFNRCNLVLYLERYSGLPDPRFWYGFYSTSKIWVRRLRGLARDAGYRREPLHFDMHSYRTVRTNRAAYFALRSPLRGNEFDRLTHEEYQGYSSYFLGVYSPYEAPLGRRQRSDLAFDASAFSLAFARALDRIGIGARGGRARPSPQVEKAAVRAVRTYLSGQGYRVSSRESDNVGYDLHAVAGRTELHVEVKGTSGVMERFFVSNNELRRGKWDKDWRLALVTRARSRNRTTRFFPYRAMLGRFDLESTGWEATPRLKRQ